ncbi:MAG: 50S ribosomal protein L22 [Chloroflexi bacterium]|nr:50S ribosomal protein L22 [Chloroflexota bacterium]
MEVTARATAVRVSPFKVRLILDEIRGKRIGEALAILHFMPSPTARVIAKIVRSAAANAENNYQIAPTTLKVVKTWADPAPMIKRWKHHARGRVGHVQRRSSHITVVVQEE